MKPDFSKIVWQLLVVISVICVLALAALTFQSLFRLLATQPETEKAAPAAGNTSAGQEVKLISDVAEQPSANPAPVPAASAYNEFCTDSGVIRQQERERQERIDNLQLAGENSDSNAVPPAKQFKQAEAQAPLL